MFQQKSPDPPILFSEVLKEERAHIRPADNTAQASAPLSALCISGGGIRSATFALGALQGLAQAGILSNLDYLSTVSGGGYNGSWLTAWKQRRNGLPISDLKPSAPFPKPGQ